MRTLVFTTMFFAAIGSASAMACTQDELLAKAQSLTAKLQALASKDANKATAWAEDCDRQPDTADVNRRCLQALRWMARGHRQTVAALASLSAVQPAGG
jgi:hypothetical protein